MWCMAFPQLSWTPELTSDDLLQKLMKWIRQRDAPRWIWANISDIYKNAISSDNLKENSELATWLQENKFVDMPSLS